MDLYVDWMLNKSIYSQFKAFYHGFHTVCASNALIVSDLNSVDKIYEPRHEISNNEVCATSKASDQPVHMPNLIRAFASRLNVL